MSTMNGSDSIALPLSPITYIQLKEKLEDHLRIEGRRSVISNYKSTLNAFMSVHQRTNPSLVGGDFDSDFEQLRDEFLEAQRKSGLQPSTYNSRKAHLNAINQFYISEIAPSDLPSNFSHALKMLLGRIGYTPHSFYQKFLKDKCALSTFKFWCSGKHTPSAESLPLIQEIERLLGAEGGTLKSRLPKKLRGTGRRKTGQTGFRAKAINARKKRYGVWTEELEQEFIELTTFKSSAVLPEGVKRHKKAVWTNSVGSKGVYIPSAKKVKGELRCFFGYCCLPKDCEDPQLRGRGMKREVLSLALLNDKEIVQGYLEFQRIRAGGKYNEGSIVFLNLVAGLLRPETGYVYQHPQLSHKPNGSVNVSVWQEMCVSVRNRLLEILLLIKHMREENDEEHFEKGRDPLEPIKNIIKLHRPLYVILRMIESMFCVMLSENAPPLQRAIQFRNILLVTLLSANPLRIRQFAIMEFDKHLVRQDDGSWWLQFKKSEFKNRRSLKTDYCVRVGEHVWPLIERYRMEFRPILAGADSCKYVFRPRSSGRHEADNTDPMSSNSLQGIITDLTQLYIPDCPGFGPHSFRHIVATDIIKANPTYGFFLAAKVLHDQIETVEQAYAHLKTSELFEPYNTHYAAAWQTIMPGTGGGAWA